MSPACTRAGIDTIRTGPLITTTPQSHVVFNGFPVAVQGATVAPHGAGGHLVATFVVGSPFFKVNGLAVVRMNHAASCGHLALASAHVIITS